MTIITGGLRARLVHDNLYNLIKGGLTAIGWYNANQYSPISFVPEPMDRDQEIPLNTLALAYENTPETQWEVGSGLTEFDHCFYVDIYGESQAFARHIAGDVTDILKGRRSDLGYKLPTVPVYDLTQATPPSTPLFSCRVEDNVLTDRGMDWTGSKPWLKNWWMVRAHLLDYYGDITDGAPYQP